MEEHGYTVIRVLGQGGSCQSRVYEVRSREGKLRVVKQLPWVSEENREMAMREVELLSSLRHPCIVAYLESFLVRSSPSLPSEDVLCLVMGRCERDLRQECLRLRLEWELAQEQGHVPLFGDGSSDRARFDEPQILSWMSQLCWGLQHLHSRKFMHRDLKPQNVLLSQGGKRALLADFGVCGQVEHTEDLRRSIVGTPAFMSPEMLQGRPYGFKTDQWALGCVLYETMALEPPFAGRCDSYAAVVNAVLHSPPLESPPGYSLELSQTVEALLARKPHDRPSNRDLLRGSLLREPFHAFIRSLESSRASRNRESPVPLPSGSPSSTSSRYRAGSRHSLLHQNSLPQLTGAEGFTGYTDPVEESRPDTGATAILSAALLVTGTQPSSSSQAAPPLLPPVATVRNEALGRSLPELTAPSLHHSDFSASSPIGGRGCSLSGSHHSRSIGIVGTGVGGSTGGSGSVLTALGGCPSIATSSAIARSGCRSGSSSVLTLAGNGSLAATSEGRGSRACRSAASTSVLPAILASGSAVASGWLPPSSERRTGGPGGATVEQEATSYDSDFDSFSGNSPSGADSAQRPRSGRSAGVSMGAEQSWLSELNSSENGSALEALEFQGSSLDEVALGREEWRHLLDEAESMLRPETPEEAAEECWKLRAAVCDTLGGPVRLNQALSFLRNRRPLGETMEADELMLQVELGDLLGDDGLQVLPFLERILELESAIDPANAGGG